MGRQFIQNSDGFLIAAFFVGKQVCKLDGWWASNPAPAASSNPRTLRREERCSTTFIKPNLPSDGCRDL